MLYEVITLIDAEINQVRNRKVFKFTLELTDKAPTERFEQLDHNRLIPSEVKRAV